ncbi:hypothetical protein R1sor_004053 [Riccia sorocarpa]|uniref:DUF7869 domain-containing protein n=1 Tax=Riccia sorocarpa TaxID=122646 RepID=A0ABD3H592_9MARC
MRKVSKKDVCEEREFFYKEPYAKRIEYTFYNYEGAYKMGQRVGFHGNHGTLKPKDTTLFAKACMKTFFQQAAEPLPHKESRKPQHRWGCVSERRSAERAKWEHDREMHLKHQMSGRNEYYSHMEMSTRTPSLYFSFIHDAMDHSKTYVRRLRDKLKSLMEHVTPLPLKVVGIINHGHEPNVVAHITVTGIWKSDPNYTISSVAKQLRDYEIYFIGDCTFDLAFNTTLVHPLFDALLDGDVFKTTVLEKKCLSLEEYFDLQQQQPISEGRRLRMLPPNLYIQLDNFAKDNKNWTLMAFCSELVARGCCKTITMFFFVVGHTHEDVDAFFSKVNAAQA